MLLTRETIFQCTHRGGEESLIQSNKYTVTRITFEKKINKFPYASSNTSVDINRIVRFAIRGIPRTTNPPVFRTKTSNPSRSEPRPSPLQETFKTRRNCGVGFESRRVFRRVLYKQRFNGKG